MSAAATEQTPDQAKKSPTGEIAPDVDPDDPRLDAFIEALACALLEDLASNPRT